MIPFKQPQTPELAFFLDYVSSYFHWVFSTKERQPTIPPPLRDRLWPFLGGTARRNGMKAMGVNFGRPFGTWLIRALLPTLKRWAILVRSLRDGTPEVYPIGYNYALV